MLAQMLHFEKDSGRDVMKRRVYSQTSSSSHGCVPTPGCRCSSCTSHPPKLPVRPNSVSLMERETSSTKNDPENNVRIGDVGCLLKAGGCDDATFVDGSYVRFAKSEADLSPVAVSHEYCYPAEESHHLARDHHSPGLSVVPPRSALPMDMKSVTSVSVAGVRRPRPRVQCMYCCEPFDPALGKGRRMCRDAPDRVMDWINVASCACVADTVAYHCCADSEGEYEPACTCPRLSCRSVVKWTVVVLMSMFLPCLCCYWPLVGCRRCAVRCGYCVPEHRAATFSH